MTDQTGATATKSASASTTVIKVGIDVSKKASTKVEVGGTINVQVNVTNTGTAAATFTSIVDSPAVVFTCGPVAVGGSLAAGASTICTGSYTAPGTPGTVNDNVTATLTDQTGAAATKSATASTTVIKVGVSVTKSATSKVEVNGTINVQVNVTNTGTAAATFTSISDTPAVAFSCGPVAINGTLDVGQTTVCTGSYPASGTPGIVNDNVTATLMDQTGAKATGSASASTTVIEAAITVAKSCSPAIQYAGANGGNITWKIVTRNLGSVPLHVYLNETMPGLPNVDFWLAAGANDTRLYTSSNLPRGNYSNTVLAVGVYQFGNTTASSSATCEVKQLGYIKIVKDAQPNDLQPFTFTRNFGANFVLDDDAGVVGDIDNLPNNVTFAVIPGTYLVTEIQPNSYWINTAITCDSVGSSGNTTTHTATIVVAANQTVTCTFVNSKPSPTRTLGFWKTHYQYTGLIFSTKLSSDPFPWTSNNSIILGYGGAHTKNITSLSQLLGVWYSNTAKMTDGTQRSALDKARILLAHQLVAAILNCAAFGCDSSVQTMINAANTAYGGTNTGLMNTYASQLDAYNNSGDTLAIGFVGPAAPKDASALADKVYWNYP